MAYDSSLVVYNSVPLSTINVTPGMDLQTALWNINTAVGTSISTNYALFNYGPYYGYTLKTPLGATITDITGFVEGTASGIGKVSSDLATFTGTTFPSYQSSINSAILTLQIPGITYSNSAGNLTISISNTDSINTVLTKLATGLGDTGNLLGTPGNAWSLILITPDPTNIHDAFNDLINYNITQNSAIAAKEPSIGTFDNSANCLFSIGGTSTDNAGDTITLLTTYVCALEKFDSSVVTTTCLTPKTNLQDWFQQLVDIADLNAANGFTALDSSMTSTSNGPCSGFTIGVDPTWTGLRNVAASVQDTTPGTLSDKLLPGTNVTLTPSAPGNQTLTIDVAVPNDAKVGVNSSDVTPDYLVSKIPATQGTWGISLVPTVTPDNSQLKLTPTVTNPYTLVQNIINYISTNPELLAAFCALKTQCDGCQCLAATAFTVTADILNTEFNLSWAAGTSLGETQTVAYRESGTTTWITNAHISAANPQAYTTTSAVVSGLNTNMVYEFQIVSNCGTGPNYSAIVTGIIYEQETVTIGANGGIISVNQAPMPSVDVIEYTLYNAAGPTPVQSTTATGINPVASFNQVLAGTYYVEYRYGTLINGVTLYSDDPSQNNAWYQSTSVIVP